MKALCQSVLSMRPDHRRAIKEETIALNRDWVYNNADCCVTYMLCPTLLKCLAVFFKLAM